MLFAGAGYSVAMHDIVESQLSDAFKDIDEQLNSLEEKKLLRGTKCARDQFALIEACNDFEEVVKGAAYVVVRLFIFCSRCSFSNWSTEIDHNDTIHVRLSPYCHKIFKTSRRSLMVYYYYLVSERPSDRKTRSMSTMDV